LQGLELIWPAFSLPMLFLLIPLLLLLLLLPAAAAVSVW
jgi:hypothetical protein